MITLSLIAVPRRLTWFFAKAAVLTVPVLIASALAVAGSALAGWLILTCDSPSRQGTTKTRAPQNRLISFTHLGPSGWVTTGRLFGKVAHS